MGQSAFYGKREPLSLLLRSLRMMNETCLYTRMLYVGETPTLLMDSRKPGFDTALPTQPTVFG